MVGINRIFRWQLFRLLNLRHLTGQRLRVGMALAGVIMGVSTFTFAPGIGNSMRESLALTNVDLYGTLDMEVRSTESGFDKALLDSVRAAPGVAAAGPIVTTGGLVVGQTELLGIFGIDPAVDQSFRAYRVAAGEWLSQPGQVLLTVPYATQKGIAVGSSITVVSAGGAHELKVVGLLATDGGFARLNGGDVMIVPLEDALALRNNNLLDSISVEAAPNITVENLRQTLQAVVRENAPNVSSIAVDRPDERGKADQDTLLLLGMLVYCVAVIILVVGSMLIYSPINVSVTQRRPEIGVLRALGLVRGDLRRIYVTEAGLLGLVGSLIGVVVGYVLVALGQNIPLPSFTTASAYVTRTGISAPIWSIPPAVFLGTVIPMLAGYFASRAATRIDPIEAMTQLRYETGEGRISWGRVAVGVVILVALLVVRYTYHGPLMPMVMIANSGIFLVFIALILIFPSFLAAAGRVLPSWMAKLGGMTGMAAAGNITRRPKRMLVIGLFAMISVAFGTLVGQSTFGHTKFVQAWDKAENFAELTLTGVTTNPFVPTYSLPTDVVEAVRARPDVEVVLAERLFHTQIKSTSATIRAVDIMVFRAAGGSYLFNQGDETAAYDRLLDTDHPAILVSGSMAALTVGLETGTTLQLDTPRGLVSVEVVGAIMGRIESNGISIIMNQALFQKWWQDSAVDRLSVKLKPGVDAQAVRRELLRQYALRGVMVYDNHEMTAIFLQPIISIQTVSTILAGLFTLVILMGLSSTLFVAVVDRRREIGMLRAVGMLRGQVTRSVILESVLLVLIGACLGVPGGYILTSLQQSAIQQLMGLGFALDTGQVAFIIVLLLVVAVIAAYVPARMAGQTDILEAMRYE